MGYKYSLDEAVGFGWNTMKNNFGFLFLVQLVSLAIVGIPLIAYGVLLNSQPGIAMLFNLIYYIALIFVGLGWKRIMLKYLDGIQPEMADLFSGAPYFLSYLGAGILFVLMYMA
ncbi:MAG: hypothetical protein ACM3PP_03215, partial [Candidatus Saccharibacteria bacterium]